MVGISGGREGGRGRGEEGLRRDRKGRPSHLKRDISYTVPTKSLSSPQV